MFKFEGGTLRFKGYGDADRDDPPEGRNVVTNTVLPRFFERKVVTQVVTFLQEVATSRPGSFGSRAITLKTARNETITSAGGGNWRRWRGQ